MSAWKGDRDRITVRLPRELHDRLKREAERQNVDTNDYIVEMLRFVINYRLQEE